MAKYKTLLGTPTDLPPSKERQYHIDAYKEAMKRKKGRVASKKEAMAKKIK